MQPTDRTGSTLNGLLIEGGIIDTELDDYKNTLVDKWRRIDLPPKVTCALRSIHEHLFDAELNVAFVRSECMLRNNNASTHFKRWVGFGMRTYIEHHRIAAAKRLLNHDELPVHAIAWAVGFSYVESFERSFKRGEQCCPSRYRTVSASSKRKFETALQGGSAGSEVEAYS